jgi:tetratricopeptide (TPR) repeat protein
MAPPPESPEDQIKDLLNSGKNAYHKGNYEHAIECCDNVLLIDPDNSEALFFRKRALSKIEKLRGKDAGGKAAAAADIEVSDAGEVPVGAANNGGAEVAVGEIKAPAGGGDPNCKSCAGSGQCHWCKGSGKCYWCKGSGKCDKCNGEGKVNGEECKGCKGSGKCHSCNGDGECYWCKGSGKCSKCSM